MIMLSQLETEIMSFFWDSACPLTLADIKLASKSRSWNSSSLGPIISKLVKKGFLKAVEVQKKGNILAFSYDVSIARDAYYSALIQQSLGENTKTSAFLAGFISNFRENGNLNSEGLNELRKTLDSWE